MDPSFLATAVQAAPQYAVAGYLIYLLKSVMGHATVDRGDYRADLDAAEERHAAEISRLRAVHAADLDALRSEMGDLRGRITELTGDLDAERRRRWHAEDIAADARRLAGDAVALVDQEPPTKPSEVKA